VLPPIPLPSHKGKKLGFLLSHLYRVQNFQFFGFAHLEEITSILKVKIILGVFKVLEILCDGSIKVVCCEFVFGGLGCILQLLNKLNPSKIKIGIGIVDQENLTQIQNL
jgi:hypothetical protein